MQGLETGADDYVVKPLAMRELVARVRAVHRRARQAVQAQAVRVVDLLAQALQVAALGQTAAAVVVVHRRLVAKVGLEEHPASGRQLLGEPQARVVAAVAVVLAQALYRALEEFTAVALVELTAADPHPVDKV